MKKNSKQAELFPMSEIIEGALVPQNIADAIESDEERGKYTAARLQKKKPELFAAVKLSCPSAFHIRKLPKNARSRFIRS